MLSPSERAKLREPSEDVRLWLPNDLTLLSLPAALVMLPSPTAPTPLREPSTVVMLPSPLTPKRVLLMILLSSPTVVVTLRAPCCAWTFRLPMIVEEFSDGRNFSSVVAPEPGRSFGSTLTLVLLSPNVLEMDTLPTFVTALRLPTTSASPPRPAATFGLIGGVQRAKRPVVVVADLDQVRQHTAGRTLVAITDLIDPVGEAVLDDAEVALADVDHRVVADADVPTRQVHHGCGRR